MNAGTARNSAGSAILEMLKGQIHEKVYEIRP
jgi:hypothetical protein